MTIVKATFKFVLLALASFVLIHIMSVFGIFIAVAYPLWWVIAPQYAPAIIRPSGNSRTGFNLRFAFLNTVVIFLISAASLGVVFLENKLIFKITSPIALKTAKFTIPSQGQYKLGEIFPMEIRVEGGKDGINAVQADLRFDPTILEVVEISTKDSFATIFVNKEIENEVGFARISGGVPSSSALTENGLFGRVLFRGKMAGVVKVEFLPSSMVLANDGKGTNILKSLASASYLILPEELPKDLQSKQEAELKTEATSDPNQIVFFNEINIAFSSDSQEEQVLGASTKKSFFNQALETIGGIDNTIINFWKDVFSKEKGSDSF